VNPKRLSELTSRYTSLRLAVVGDFCLDRYLEIDPEKKEVSIETGLPVHNVVRVRSQPGAAGTILNNLAALGVGAIYPVGFAGKDGEGFELRRCLETMPGVLPDHFVQTELRRTFTYCKPLVLQPGKPPVELNRLDSKNWTPTPPEISARLSAAVAELAPRIDGTILLDQVDLPETGVITTTLLKALSDLKTGRPKFLGIADGRRGLKGFPPLIFKMNSAELARLLEARDQLELAEIKRQAAELARRNSQPVFVTMSERGILGALPTGDVFHCPALPVRGEIDVVGAGDAVTANLAAALAGGAAVPEALEIAMLAASLVLHQLGTTGTASVTQISSLNRACGWSEKPPIQPQ